jgi:tetratricopeptide (TPR) repeat protein
MGTTEREKKFDIDLTLENYDAVERDVRQLLASSSMTDWGTGYWAYFMALRNQGRLREAIQFSNTGWLPGLPPLSVERSPSATHQAILALETGNAPLAARYFEQTLAADRSRWSSGVQGRYMAWWGTLRGMAIAAAGDTSAVRVLADSVERWGRASAFGRDRKAHHYLRGLLHAAAGRHEDAVREYRAAVYSPSLGFTRVNYEMARSLLHLNRPQEAAAILQPALRGAPDASNLYVSRTELHELLAESFDRAGERDSAAVHYRAVVRAWRRADLAFHARRDRAQEWLARNASAAVRGTASR